MNIPKYIFPPDYKIVRKDKDLYILHVRYHRRQDVLRILYKNIKTGEKILDEFERPQVPVFISNVAPKFFKEYTPYRDTHFIMVPYKYKSDAIQKYLFKTKSWSFKDSRTGLTVHKTGFTDLKQDTMFKNPEYLLPQLLFADVSIERLIMLEYCIDKYEDIEPGVRMESINSPTLDLSAFDIETSYDENKNPFINANTFVDDKSMTVYGYYLERDDYPNQSFIRDNNEEFITLFRDRFNKAIDEMELDAKPSKIKVIKNIAKTYANELKVVTKGFSKEEDLIKESCKLMFTDNKPDIYMAFNAAYDVTVFNRRIKELNLPIGTFNNAKWINNEPPVMEDMNEDYTLRNDSIDPTKRMTSFDNISYGHIVCYANAYYSNRKGRTFSERSLEATSTRETGFGKLDFSKEADHILKLPYVNFVTHMIYAMIDSIILLILEKLTKDFDSKYSYMYRTKVDMKTTASNNQAITSSLHADAFYNGNVPSNNWKKHLYKFNVSELRAIEKLTGIDYVKIKNLNNNLPGKKKGEIRGGLVANPNKFVSGFKAISKKFKLLKEEVSLTKFTKALYTAYLDLMSHYPVTMLSRQTFIETMFGDVCRIFRRNSETVVETSRWRDKLKPNYVNSLGGINLSVANEDVISYGNRVFDLPSMSDIASSFFEMDSKPLTESNSHDVTVPVDYKQFKSEYKLMSVLRSLDSEVTTPSMKDNDIATTTKMFHLNNAEHTYMHTYVKYDFNIELGKKIFNEDGIVFGTHSTKDFKRKEHSYVPPKNTPNLNTGEYKDLDQNILVSLSNASVYSVPIYLPHDNKEFKCYMSKHTLYFPFDTYLKNIKNPKSNINNSVMIEDVKYKILERDMTFQLELNYNIKHKEYIVNTTQVMDLVKI